MDKAEEAGRLTYIDPRWFCHLEPKCPNANARNCGYCLRKLRLDAGRDTGLGGQGDSPRLGESECNPVPNGVNRLACPRPDPNMESCKALEEINGQIKRGLDGQYVRPLAIRSHWLEAVKRLGWLIGDRENGK